VKDARYQDQLQHFMRYSARHLRYTLSVFASYANAYASVSGETLFAVGMGANFSL
jgi:hypothetical protein